MSFFSMKKVLLTFFFGLVLVILIEIFFYLTLPDMIQTKITSEKKIEKNSQMSDRPIKKKISGIFKRLDKDFFYLEVNGQEQNFSYRKPKPYLIFISGNKTEPAKMTDLKEGVNVEVEITEASGSSQITSLAILK